MNQREVDSINVRKLFLDFYSSEINTHGRLIIGFAVILFTLIEIKLRLYVPRSLQSSIIFPCIWLVSFAIWYSLFRLLRYGMLANAVVHMDLPQKESEDIVSLFKSEVREWVKKHYKKRWVILEKVYVTIIICMILASVTAIIFQFL